MYNLYQNGNMYQTPYNASYGGFMPSQGNYTHGTSAFRAAEWQLRASNGDTATVCTNEHKQNLRDRH